MPLGKPESLCPLTDSRCPEANRENQTPGFIRPVAGVIRWDEFCMTHSVTTIDENRVGEQYAVPRRVIQRSSTLLVLESPRMSLTRDALWHNGL